MLANAQKGHFSRPDAGRHNSVIGIYAKLSPSLREGRSSWSPVAQLVSYFGGSHAAQTVSAVLTGRYEDSRDDEVLHIIIRRIRKLKCMSL